MIQRSALTININHSIPQDTLQSSFFCCLALHKLWDAWLNATPVSEKGELLSGGAENLVLVNLSVTGRIAWLLDTRIAANQQLEGVGS